MRVHFFFIPETIHNPIEIRPFCTLYMHESCDLFLYNYLHVLNLRFQVKLVFLGTLNDVAVFLYSLNTSFHTVFIPSLILFSQKNCIECPGTSPRVYISASFINFQNTNYIQNRRANSYSLTRISFSRGPFAASHPFRCS